jgi:serine/threonine-protein kinase HipA
MKKPQLDFTKQRIQIALDFGGLTPPHILGECMWVASERRAAFEWSKQAIASGLNVSPFKLPLATGVHFAEWTPFEGLHGLFSDSIPDGFGLRLMNKGLASAGYALGEVSPLHRLAWVGARGVGALTYTPIIDGGSAQDLMDISVVATHAANAQVEAFANIPRSVIRAGGSALGARPKFWAAISPERQRVILSDTAKTPEGFEACLLKFAPAKGDEYEPYFEAACLKLAAEHGVNAARGELLLHASGAALAVHRFDRGPDGARLHTQSVAALLGLDFRNANMDYTAFAQLVKQLAGEAELEVLYRQVCFNVAMSMRDDHTKNFAFCMNNAGTWHLSPAFDLCPSVGLGYTQEHTMTLNGKGTNISRDDLFTFADSLGLSQQLACEGLDQARAAASKFEKEALSLGAPKSPTQAWVSRFKLIDKELAQVMV